MKVRAWFSFIFLVALAATTPAPRSAGESGPAQTGWICGAVLLENGGFAGEARVNLYPQGQPDAEPLREMTADARGAFCLKDLAAGFYELRAQKDDWPLQPARRVEVRAGLINRLDPVELELEPGEPRVRYAESFDGMPPGAARRLLEQLLAQGDTASLTEAARRFLPKRGVAVDINRLALGFDPKPLVLDLVRRIENTVLPPVKTARYLYLIGELGDPRTLEVVVPLLIKRLRDGRRLPAILSVSDRATYVSDIAMQELLRFAPGRDFKWVYGRSPIQNQGSFSRVRDWWRNEQEKKRENSR